MVTVINKKPKTTVFLEPMRFLIVELNGANNIYAKEKMDRIRETKNSSTLESSSHFLSEQKVGRKDATFIIIMFPMHRAIREETRMRCFISDENFSVRIRCSSSSLFFPDELSFFNVNSFYFCWFLAGV